MCHHKLVLSNDCKLRKKSLIDKQTEDHPSLSCYHHNLVGRHVEIIGILVMSFVSRTQKNLRHEGLHSLSHFYYAF